MIDKTHSNNPAKDKLAEIFLKYSNEIVLSIIK